MVSLRLSGWMIRSDSDADELSEVSVAMFPKAESRLRISQSDELG